MLAWRRLVRNRTLLSLFALLSLILMPTTSYADEDARLASFFKDYLEDWMKRSPLEASRMGDHRYDDRLDDLSPKVRAANLAKQKELLEQLAKTIDFNKLTMHGKVDYQILRDSFTRAIWIAENSKPFEEDPRIWNEYIADSVFLNLTQSTVEKSRAIDAAASRIRYIPAVVEAAQDSLKNPPRTYLETAIKQNKGSIAFYEKGIFELTGETPGVSVLSSPCKAAVESLKEYQKFLEGTLLPKAVGEWRIGREKFAKKLEMELDAGIGADEVLKEAEAEADRVRRDMYVIARQLWSKLYPGKPLPPDDAAGRQACIRLVLKKLGEDHGAVDSMVADAKQTTIEIKAFIKAKDILRLPEPDRCDIVEMPEFQRGNSTAYLNPAPPLDPKAKSVYAVSPPPRDWDDRKVQSYLEEYNRSMMKLLTIHEAYPGHYVQLEYSNRHPSLLRKILWSGIFAEGWAVYTEQMMLDQGFGEGDLSLRIHQLKWYLRAVTNAILDHRMHCTQMTDAEALKLLVEGAFQTEGEALGKIVRSKQSSCQLSTYFVGRMAFYRLRQSISREQGDGFDLGRYHEAVLSQGTISVKYLPELVRERLKQPR
jgi:uncharacterized protein (DUF885 family)